MKNNTAAQCLAVQPHSKKVMGTKNACEVS